MKYKSKDERKEHWELIIEPDTESTLEEFLAEGGTEKDFNKGLLEGVIMAPFCGTFGMINGTCMCMSVEEVFEYLDEDPRDWEEIL